MTKAKVVCKYCGKEYSSSGIRLHESNCKSNTSSTPKKTTNKSTAVSNDATNTKEVVGIDIKEVNMASEYTEKKEVIEPKKEEPAFQCGQCGAQFVKRPKFCHECGVSFD